MFLASRLPDSEEAALWTIAGIVAARRGDPISYVRLRRAISLSPAAVEARIALTTVLSKAGKHVEAIDEARNLAQISLDDAETLFHVGLVFVDAKEFLEASHWFERALELSPRSPDILRNLARAQRDAGLEAESVETLRRLTELDPTASNFLALGQLLLAHGRLSEAQEAANQALKRDSTHGQAHLLKALALAEAQQGHAAESHLRKAIKANPHDGIARAALGFWLQEQGDFEPAHAELEEAVRLRPEHGFAHYNLYRARRATVEDEPRLGLMEGYAGSERLNSRDRSYFHYALGKAREDLGDHETAMHHFDEGNRLAHLVWLSGRPWDLQSYAGDNDRMIETFDKEFIRGVQEQGEVKASPIFIVGKIRSGTSLLEQIISSHSLVRGLGELPFWHKHSDGLKWPPQARDIHELAKRYLAELPAGERTTDKMPHNYALLGLIHAALPQAKFIHVKRNPVDNCLSIYTTAYQRPPVFAHRKDNIAFAYREYLRLMAHWRQVLPPSALLELNYEDLVVNRDARLGEILDFLELPFEEGVLHHETNRRAVRTPSLWQVRQPLYTSSIDRWKRFARWIPEFTELAR